LRPRPLAGLQIGDTMLPAVEMPDSIANRNAFALAGLRIAVGCLFLIFGQYKVFGTQFTLGGGFQWWINRFLQDGAAYPFAVPVLQRIVLPHATAFAFLVAYGELAIGLALVFGIWVRIASAFGLLHMLVLLFSSNYPGAHVPLWQYFGASLDHSVLALCFFTFIGSRSDQVLSTKEWGLGRRVAGVGVARDDSKRLREQESVCRRDR